MSEDRFKKFLDELRRFMDVPPEKEARLANLLRMLRIEENSQAMSAFLANFAIIHDLQNRIDRMEDSNDKLRSKIQELLDTQEMLVSTVGDCTTKLSVLPDQVEEAVKDGSAEAYKQVSVENHDKLLKLLEVKYASKEDVALDVDTLLSNIGTGFGKLSADFDKKYRATSATLGRTAEDLNALIKKDTKAASKTTTLAIFGACVLFVGVVIGKFFA